MFVDLALWAIKGNQVKVKQVPHHKAMSVQKILEFISTKWNVSDYMPKLKANIYKYHGSEALVREITLIS